METVWKWKQWGQWCGEIVLSDSGAVTRQWRDSLFQTCTTPLALAAAPHVSNNNSTSYLYLSLSFLMWSVSLLSGGRQHEKPALPHPSLLSLLYKTSPLEDHITSSFLPFHSLSPPHSFLLT